MASSPGAVSGTMATTPTVPHTPAEETGKGEKNYLAATLEELSEDEQPEFNGQPPTENYKTMADFEDLESAQQYFEKELSELSQTQEQETKNDPRQQPLGKKDQDLEEKLQAALKDDNVDVRSPLGQKFARQHSAGEAKLTYMERKSYAQKKAFRLEWARSQYAQLQEKKQYSRAYQRIDTTKGRYLPFARIVAEEGADAAALKAALKYCSKSARMGGRWVSFNAMTERWEYLYVSREFVQNFKESWTMYRTQIKEGCQPPPAKNQEKKTEKETEKTDVEESASKRFKRQPSTVGGTTPDEQKKQKSALDVALSKYPRVKTDYGVALTKAGEIVTAVESGDIKWRWANNAENVGILQEALAALKVCVEGKNLRKFLLKSPQELRKEEGGDALLKDVQLFLSELPPLISVVQKRAKGLLLMQQARLANE